MNILQWFNMKVLLVTMSAKVKNRVLPLVTQALSKKLGNSLQEDSLRRKENGNNIQELSKLRLLRWCFSFIFLSYSMIYEKEIYIYIYIHIQVSQSLKIGKDSSLQTTVYFKGAPSSLEKFLFMQKSARETDCFA